MKHQTTRYLIQTYGTMILANTSNTTWFTILMCTLSIINLIFYIKSSLKE